MKSEVDCQGLDFSAIEIPQVDPLGERAEHKSNKLQQLDQQECQK